MYVYIRYVLYLPYICIKVYTYSSFYNLLYESFTCMYKMFMLKYVFYIFFTLENEEDTLQQKKEEDRIKENTVEWKM